MITKENYQNLQKNERILWKRSKQKNLVGFINWGIIGFLGLIAFLWFYSYFFFDFDLLNIGLVVFTLTGIMVLLLLTVYLYWRMKKRLELSFRELRHYEEFDLITTQRYINRNYYFNFTRNYVNYSNNSYDRKKDLLSLNLSKIEYIVFNKTLNIFLFLTEHHLKKWNYNPEDFSYRSIDYGDEFIFIKFSKNENGIQNLLEILGNLPMVSNVERNKKGCIFSIEKEN